MATMNRRSSNQSSGLGGNTVSRVAEYRSWVRVRNVIDSSLPTQKTLGLSLKEFDFLGGRGWRVPCMHMLSRCLSRMVRSVCPSLVPPANHTHA
jgi:hypothetical protein